MDSIVIYNAKVEINLSIFFAYMHGGGEARPLKSTKAYEPVNLIFRVKVALMHLV
ncbi:hypothetical protein [Clostridium sp. CF012]|uniref:hypothetical protein n=1 Tax=Clostridium sp. CF012 TaxID=2843319 RepID=UPI001C0BB385|nr:hypothetical protein [Clostridium sp. CF012]MBU3145836.1 hypothetical protein [Clostridium sp. CF012]